MEDAQGLCAVCLVARVPFWGLLLFRLLPVTTAFFELMEGACGSVAEQTSSLGLPAQLLVQLYDQLNTVNFHLMRYTEITFNLEAGLPPFIMAVNPRRTIEPNPCSLRNCIPAGRRPAKRKMQMNT